MRVRNTKQNMTEHASQTDPAKTLRSVISDQKRVQSSQLCLRSVNEQQASTNQWLDQLTTLIQNLQTTTSPHPAADVASPSPSAFQPASPPLCDVTAPTPEVFFSSESSSCSEFLLPCSLIFNGSPHSFPSDDTKISYMVGLFWGKTLRWAEALFARSTDFWVLSQT